MIRRLLRRGGGNDNVPPGMPIRTQIGMIGSSPQNSAFLAMKQANEQQASLASAVGGSNIRYKYKKGGATGNVNVPVFASMPYTPNGGPGNTPNDLIVQNSISGTQGAANSKYDQGALDIQKAGRRRTKTRRTKTRRTKTRRTKTRRTKTRRTKTRK